MHMSAQQAKSNTVESTSSSVSTHIERKGVRAGLLDWWPRLSISVTCQPISPRLSIQALRSECFKGSREASRTSIEQMRREQRGLNSVW